MIITTSTELRNLTGSYYANNDFEKVRTEVELETEAIIRLIGSAVYLRAKSIYVAPDAGEEEGTISEGASELDKQLLNHLQLPIALGAAFRYYQANLVSHGDSARKVKLDKDNESMAWEWMIDRDDSAHRLKIQRATDRLIAWLDASNIEEWTSGPEKKLAKELFIPDTASLQQHFPVDHSGLFYHTIRPFIAEIQRREIRKALADDYVPLLEAFKTQNVPADKEVLLSYVQQALALLAMSKALTRLSIQVLPEGVVQKFTSMGSTDNASQIPSTEDLRKYSLFLERDAQLALDEIRQYRYENSPEYNPSTLLPGNDPKHKFART